jgi:hypothetical protein
MMQPMRYTFIQVIPDDTGEMYAGRPMYDIVNNRSGDFLGQILWYPAWRKWVARFYDNAVWSTDCLENVNDAIRTITNGESQ